MLVDLSVEDLENLDSLLMCGPPDGTIDRAVEGEYESWHTEGDDFGAFCYGLKVVQEIIVNSDMEHSGYKLHLKLKEKYNV